MGEIWSKKWEEGRGGINCVLGRHVHARCLTRGCLAMQIMRTPDGEWLLYSCACCATDQYDVSSGCRGCHKGQCGPAPCSRPSALPPLPAGNVTLWRRERPKMLFDPHGRPTHLFVSWSPQTSAGYLDMHLTTECALGRTRRIRGTSRATEAGRSRGRSRWSPRSCGPS